MLWVVPPGPVGPVLMALFVRVPSRGDTPCVSVTAVWRGRKALSDFDRVFFPFSPYSSPSASLSMFFFLSFSW